MSKKSSSGTRNVTGTRDEHEQACHSNMHEGGHLHVPGHNNMLVGEHVHVHEPGHNNIMHVHVILGEHVHVLGYNNTHVAEHVHCARAQ